MVFQVIGAFEKKIDQESSTSNENDQLNTFYEIEHCQKIFVVKTRAELELKLKDIVEEEMTETKFDYEAFNEFLNGKSDRFEDKQRNLVVTCRIAQKTTESDEEEDQINPQKIDNLNHEVSEKATKKDNETSLNGNDHCQLNDNCKVPKTGSMTSKSAVANGKKMSNCQILDVNIDCRDKSERVNIKSDGDNLGESTISEVTSSLSPSDSDELRVSKESVENRLARSRQNSDESEKDLVVLRQTSVNEDELVSGQRDEDFMNEDNSSTMVISQKGIHEKPADSPSVNDDNNKHLVNEYGSGQQGSELAKIREEINVKSLYEEALMAYKPPVSSSIDNSKNDDGKIKILKKPYELFPNDLIIHVRSERGIEIWTKVRGSFSNEYQIPSDLKETKPVSKYDRKLNKLALKNLHQHLEGLITEDDPKDDPNDTKDYLCGLSLDKVSIPDLPDPYKKEKEIHQFFKEKETNLGTDIRFDYNLYQKIMIDRLRKSKNLLAKGIDLRDILLSNPEADKNEMASGGALYLPSTMNDHSLPYELVEESMQFLNSKVETNSEEQSAINNSEESSQDASNNKKRPRTRRNK
ncbi:hypothetical protein TKK_0001943 [Trichogramma kaykai]|uniref:Uncharacterized protein n=1 Tax=Trichogramma kaykai TaxID=54128 RepID=A0ABD2X8K4_9HYME